MLYMEQKHILTWTKYHSKMIQNAQFYTPHMSDIPIQNMQSMHMDSLGNTHTLKVDRNF